MLLNRGQSAGPSSRSSGVARPCSRTPSLGGNRLCMMRPRYLQSNTRNHIRLFTAIGDVLDIAMDPDVAARSMYISVEEVKNKRCLTFTNSGNGMTPDKVHRVLSSGESLEENCGTKRQNLAESKLLNLAETSLQHLAETKLTGPNETSFGESVEQVYSFGESVEENSGTKLQNFSENKLLNLAVTSLQDFAETRLAGLSETSFGESVEQVYSLESVEENAGTRLQNFSENKLLNLAVTSLQDFAESRLTGSSETRFGESEEQMYSFGESVEENCGTKFQNLAESKLLYLAETSLQDFAENKLTRHNETSFGESAEQVYSFGESVGENSGTKLQNLAENKLPNLAETSLQDLSEAKLTGPSETSFGELVEKMYSFGESVEDNCATKLLSLAETSLQDLAETKLTGPNETSFGITDKTIKKSQSHIGVSGNGFRSSFMRLGKDVLVVTKTGTTLTAGYLSQKYLDHIKTQEVIVPVVSFDQENKKLIVTGNSLSSMETILKYSVFCSEKELLTQFDAIPGKKGSRIVIWNIHRNKDGKTELDFDTDRSDILITDFDKKYKGATSELPEAEYSLRAYCGILYMKPQMRIFLRSRRVTAYLIDKNLAEVECDIYKPTCTKKQVKITFGIPCNNYKHYGVMMYHNNRLVKIQKVGCQVKPNSGEGVGVIGVIECNFLKPVYNKQDFEYTKEYKLTISALAFKLNSYWKAKISQEHFQCPVIGRSNLIPDETWVQCGECLKWRKLPGHIDPAIVRSPWLCYYNPNPKYRRCSSPEEYDITDQIQPLNKAKKQDHAVEKEWPRENEKNQVQNVTEFQNKAIENKDTDSPNVLPSFEDSRTPLHLIKHQDFRASESCRKYKWLFSEKPIEKRRKLDKSMTAAPSCYSMTKPSKRVEAAVSCPEGKNSYDRASVSRSEPPHLSPEYSEIIKHTSHSRDISDLYSETRGQRQGSLLSEEFNQMPKLVAEGSSSGSANKEVSKGPYVAVVGIVKGPSESGSPIQLVPLNQEQLVEKRKAAEPWHSGPGSSQAFATSTKKKKRVSEKNGHCKTPKLKNQRKREKLKRTKKKLERALAERNLFQQKVEELEHERNHWHSEFKKVQNELKTCNTRESEGLYWSKKHMGYRQAEFQLMKAELEKTKQEKKELKDKLKEIKVLLGRLQDAQAAGGSSEEVDVESL